MPAGHLPLGAVGVAGLCVAVAACMPVEGRTTATTAEDRTTVRVDFEGLTDGVISGREVEFPAGADVPVRAVLLTRGPDHASVVAGRNGGAALRLPEPVGSTSTEAHSSAVILVEALSAAPPHPINPAAQPFSIGASFRLHAKTGGSQTEGAQEKGGGVTDAADNGDNLVQLGDFDDPSQYKIQLDRGRPSCRVAGDAGDVFVEADVEVEADRWYDVTCRRDADGLELWLREYRDDGTTLDRTWRAEGRTGKLGGLPPTQPLALGGKLTPDGRLVRSNTDQFNGVIDDVFVTIEG